MGGGFEKKQETYPVTACFNLTDDTASVLTLSVVFSKNLSKRVKEEHDGLLFQGK